MILPVNLVSYSVVVLIRLRYLTEHRYYWYEAYKTSR